MLQVANQDVEVCEAFGGMAVDDLHGNLVELLPCSLPMHIGHRVRSTSAVSVRGPLACRIYRLNIDVCTRVPQLCDVHGDVEQHVGLLGVPWDMKQRMHPRLHEVEMLPEDV